MKTESVSPVYKRTARVASVAYLAAKVKLLEEVAGDTSLPSAERQKAKRELPEAEAALSRREAESAKRSAPKKKAAATQEPRRNAKLAKAKANRAKAVAKGWIISAESIPDVRRDVAKFTAEVARLKAILEDPSTPEEERADYKTKLSFAEMSHLLTAETELEELTAAHVEAEAEVARIENVIGLVGLSKTEQTKILKKLNNARDTVEVLEADLYEGLPEAPGPTEDDQKDFRPKRKSDATIGHHLEDLDSDVAQASIEAVKAAKEIDAAYRKASLTAEVGADLPEKLKPIRALVDLVQDRPEQRALLLARYRVKEDPRAIPEHAILKTAFFQSKEKTCRMNFSTWAGAVGRSRQLEVPVEHFAVWLKGTGVKKANRDYRNSLRDKEEEAKEKALKRILVEYYLGQYASSTVPLNGDAPRGDCYAIAFVQCSAEGNVQFLRTADVDPEKVEVMIHQQARMWAKVNGFNPEQFYDGGEEITEEEREEEMDEAA